MRNIPSTFFDMLLYVVNLRYDAFGLTHFVLFKVKMEIVGLKRGKWPQYMELRYLLSLLCMQKSSTGVLFTSNPVLDSVIFPAPAIIKSERETMEVRNVLPRFDDDMEDSELVARECRSLLLDFVENESVSRPITALTLGFERGLGLRKNERKIPHISIPE